MIMLLSRRYDHAVIEEISADFFGIGRASAVTYICESKRKRFWRNAGICISFSDGAMTGDAMALFGGRWAGSSDGRVVGVTNPADADSTVGTVPSLCSRDVKAALTAAREGIEQWRATSVLDRAAVLSRASQLLLDSATEPVPVVVAECGKTTVEASIEVKKSSDFFGCFASLGGSRVGEMLSYPHPGARAWTRVEPVGIVVAIIPFNDPLIAPARKPAPALIARNAVVLKPSMATRMIALKVGQILLDVGISPKALSVLTGAVDPVVTALLDSDLVASMSFTGSTSVGRNIEGLLAGRAIRVQCELGGTNTAVVFSDADVGQAVPIAAGGFVQAGQRCTATSCVLVEGCGQGPFLDELVDQVGGLQVGHGGEPNTTIRPVIGEDSVERVLGAVDRSVEMGAQLLRGGARLGGELQRGCFLSPTNLFDTPIDCPAWTEERFGPVVAVRSVDCLEQAISEVNRSPYGLSAAIFSRRSDLVGLFIKRVETG